MPHARIRAADRRPRARRQRGAAIITALLVVALAAILVSGLLWRQEVQVRRVENQRLLAQAQWIMRGATDGTRLVLRSAADTAGNVTYLGGQWSVPIAETKLSDFLGPLGDTRAQQGANSYVSGSIEDAQARFNLRNLVKITTPGSLGYDIDQIAALARLMALLGLDGEKAREVAVQLRAGLANSVTRFQGVGQFAAAPASEASAATAASGPAATDPVVSAGDDNSSAPPLQMTSVDALLRVPGFTPEMVERLRPFVIVLPIVTKLNMNTATPEVIAAMLPGVDLSSAQALVARRENAFFRNTGDITLALQGAGVPSTAVDTTQLDVTSSFFIVHGRVRHERAELNRRTLIYRDLQTHATRIISVRDEP